MTLLTDKEYFSTKYWHYNDHLKSVDYQYVGQIQGDWNTDNLEFTADDARWSRGKDFDFTDNHGDRTRNYELKFRHNVEKWGYTRENTKYYERHDGLPEWCSDIADACGLENCYTALQKQAPGSVLPWHIDSYRSYMANMDTDSVVNVRRYIVFVEPWHWGHFVQIGNSVITKWQKGDVISWDFQMPHLSSCAGIVPKFTLKLTGIETKHSLRKRNDKVARI